MESKPADNETLLLAAAILLAGQMLAGIGPVYLIELLSKHLRRCKVSSTHTDSVITRISSPSSAHVKVFITKDGVIQFLAQVGGGVLLYTSLIHMLPEARHNYESYRKTVANTSNKYTDETGNLPMVDMLACAGFFGIFLLDELLHMFLLKKNHKSSDRKKATTETAADIQMGELNETSRATAHQNGGQQFEMEKTDSDGKTLLSCIAESLLILLAFSTHALFDGISVGVQTNSKIWTVLVAIMSHKVVITFVLSMQVHRQACPNGQKDPLSVTRATITLWMFNLIFASLSPTGVLIIMLLGNNVSPDNGLYHTLLASIASGTILYIVFLEIIDKSTSRRHLSGLVQWVALILGFGLIHFISILFKDNE